MPANGKAERVARHESRNSMLSTTRITGVWWHLRITDELRVVGHRFGSVFVEEDC
jgi:hypothetical protein